MIISTHIRAVVNSPNHTLLLIVMLLTLSACATKSPPTFFPSAPAPPRIQLLTSFDNEGSLRQNKTLDMIIGQSTSNYFSKAYGLAFHNGKLYVADSGKGNPGIAVVDFAEKSIRRYTEGVTKPVTLDVDTDGTVYICDLAADRPPAIIVLDNQLQFVRRMTLDIEGYRPASVLVDGELLYVADVRLHRIRVLDKQTGELLRTIGEGDRLGWPVDLTKTPDGNILVTETGAQRLSLFSPTGELLNQIGSPGDRTGNFTRPKATDTDHDGNIYAVDVTFQNVQIFDSQGNILMYFGTTGDRNSLFMPAGIAISYDNLDVFQTYAEPDFKLEYIVAVSSQGGPPNFGSKVTIYGFGKKEGADYSLPELSE